MTSEHGGERGNGVALVEGPVLSIQKWPSNGHLIADCARLGYLHKDWRTLDPTYGFGRRQELARTLIEDGQV